MYSLIQKLPSRNIYSFVFRSYERFILISTLSLIMLTLSTASAAQSQRQSKAALVPITISAPRGLQPMGVTFVLPIVISDITGQGISSIQFNLDYIPSVIDPIGSNFGCSTTGTLAGAAGLSAQCNVSPDGKLRVSISGVTPISGGGTLIKLSFKSDPLASPGDLSPLTFSNVFFENNLGELENAPADGLVRLLSPSAANTSFGGQTLTADGRGIRGATVLLTAANGETRTAISSDLGYFRFDNVEAGQNYIVSVASKRFTFASRVITVTDEIGSVDLVAEP